LIFTSPEYTTGALEDEREDEKRLGVQPTETGLDTEDAGPDETREESTTLPPARLEDKKAAAFMAASVEEPADIWEEWLRESPWDTEVEDEMYEEPLEAFEDAGTWSHLLRLGEKGDKEKRRQVSVQFQAPINRNRLQMLTNDLRSCYIPSRCRHGEE